MDTFVVTLVATLGGQKSVARSGVAAAQCSMGDVRVRLVDEPDDVVRIAGGWLAEHRIAASVPSTILATAQTGPPGGADRAGRRRRDWSWAIALDGRPREGERVVAIGVQTPPHPAVLVSPDAEIAALIADAWHDVGRRLPGVSGSAAGAEAFARRWATLTRQRARLVLREGLHVLELFAPAVGVPGRSRTSGPDDLDLVARWFAEFQAEALPHLPPHLDVEALRRGLTEGRFVLWEDAGAPVSLAAWRTAAGAGRIGPVYTPPEHRRHGYGAAVTSAVTRAILDAGADPMLYTDLANPTSNGVYARLGYRMVAEAGVWIFD